MSARRVLALFGHPGRGGFNEAAVEGARRAERAGQPLRIEWIADTDPQLAHRHAVRTGLDLLIAHGGQGDAPVAEVAPRFPRTQFAVTQGSLTAPNVASYEILQEHSAFLAGVLAGLRAADGRAAHLSGERVRPGLKGRAAMPTACAAPAAAIRSPVSAATSMIPSGRTNGALARATRAWSSP